MNSEEIKRRLREIKSLLWQLDVLQALMLIYEMLDEVKDEEQSNKKG